MRIELQGAVAVLHLEAGKANAMNFAFLDRLDALVAEVVERAAPSGSRTGAAPHGGASVRAAVIIGSGTAFSAGLDLPALVDFDRAALTVFLERFEATLLRIFELPIPLVAAINGHAIAGGCALALQADARIMAGGKIGLNESQLGLGLPSIILEPLRAQVPPSSLVPIALEGRLFVPEDALRLGLIDEIAPEALLPSVRRAEQLAQPGAGQIKAALRKPIAAAIRATSRAENERFVSAWFMPGAQERIRAAVLRVTKK